jgi:phosphoribosylglycinamide formyltransferase-1
MSEKVPVAVFASGSGTNLQALLDACSVSTFPAAIVAVVSDRPRAYALERATNAGVPTVVIRRKGHPSREAHEQAILDALAPYAPEWICLAGYMRLLSETLLKTYPQRILNIHPALLPAFPGLHGQTQAFEHGVHIAGATVHLVDGGTDTGPILCQGAVPVRPDDDADRLQQRVLTMEHRLYPRALRWAVEGRIHVEGRKARLSPAPSEPAFDWLENDA